SNLYKHHRANLDFFLFKEGDGIRSRNVSGVQTWLFRSMTIAFSDGREGIIVDGEPLKQINSSYNYAIASLTSKLDSERRDISKKVNSGLTQKDPTHTKV